MITYRVDEEGHCQAVPYTSHCHLLQMVNSRNLDHIMHYPPDNEIDARFVVYLSMHNNVVFLVPIHNQNGCPEQPPHTMELSKVYSWVLQHRRIYAYPFLRIDVVRPARNESHANPTTIGQWCDTQIDAFTLFRCKRLLQRFNNQGKPTRPKRSRSGTLLF